MEQWIPKYETLSRLDERSLFWISRCLDRFLADYGPLTWPVNCFHLIRHIRQVSGMRLDLYEFSEALPGAETTTSFFPAEGRYVIRITASAKNWPARSAARRCNFTLAHELGHIFLGHLDIPDARKTEARREREDAEADEFASRLLMPEALMRSARFPSLREMASAFLVSEQACFHRMNNLRALDRLALPAPACPACGNRRVSPCASWCRLCGASLGEAVPAETVRMLKRPFLPECPVCGSGVPAAGGECPDCGYPRDNPCQAEYDQPRHPNPPDARFCETCGAETLYAQLVRSPRFPRYMPLRERFSGAPESLPGP